MNMNKTMDTIRKVPIDKVEQAAAALDCTIEVIDNKPMEESL